MHTYVSQADILQALEVYNIKTRPCNYLQNDTT